MPHKRSPRASQSQNRAQPVFLRSINVGLDAEYPDRIAHFRPTAKSVVLLRALAGLGQDRAHLVVAPYGSGKSLAAAYLLHLVENPGRSSRMLRAVQGRLGAIAPDLARFAERR